LREAMRRTDDDDRDIPPSTEFRPVPGFPG
jgi:hypothetical protein